MCDVVEKEVRLWPDYQGLFALLQETELYPIERRIYATYQGCPTF